MSTGLRVNVGELLRHPGERLPVSKDMPADGLAISASHAVSGTMVELDADLESLGDGIVVTGTIDFEWEGECRRCLEPVFGSDESSIRELFTKLDDGDTYPLEGDEIDLEPLIREAVLVRLPLAPLCREDCPGPAPEVFPTGPPLESDEPPKDPRWAALDDLDLG